MQKKIKNLVSKLKKLSHVDRKTIKKFLKRIQSDKNITQEENPEDHFCAFFVPVYLLKLEIFIGYHIKAQEWIPPGGHIERGEMPGNTVYREFSEELSYDLTDEKVKLFDIGITRINNLDAKRKCKIHWDFWYYVKTKKIDFVYDKSEFHNAGWFTIDRAVKKAYREEQIISHLLNLKKLLVTANNR